MRAWAKTFPAAHRALSEEPGVGLLLPCNVCVEQIESGSLHGALGLGGTQGTSLCGDIMQRLPYGFHCNWVPTGQ